jgi:chromosome segregation ATPase
MREERHPEVQGRAMTDQAVLQQQITALQASVNDLNRIVGGLVSSVTTLTTTWVQQDTVAVEGRRTLHQKIDELKAAISDITARLTALSTRVSTMEEQVKDIKPSVEAFRTEKAQNEGAKKLGYKVWFAISTVCGVVGFAISEFIAYLKH